MLISGMKKLYHDIEYKHSRGDCPLYPQQKACAKQILSFLQDRHVINILVTALTQAGKTGAMSAIIQNYVKVPHKNYIDIQNIYIITGLSSKDWKLQTKQRMPDSLQARIYHRDNLLTKFVPDVIGRKNVLIIMDEIHVASKIKQTICKAFHQAGLQDKNNLLQNDVKLIQFTATPNGNAFDISDWGAHSRKVRMDNGAGYTSCFDLLKDNRIRQFQDLECVDSTTQKVNKTLLAQHFTTLKKVVCSFPNPRYHIIRICKGKQGGIIANNFRQQFLPYKYYFWDHFHSSQRVIDINNTLSIMPEKHTFIFIKEKLRCAKTLNKQYLGVLYERYVDDPDDSVIIQGLVGRMTGYDDTPTRDSVCFSNIQTIQRYEQLWNSDFSPDMEWRSSTTVKLAGKMGSTKTFNDPALNKVVLPENAAPLEETETCTQRGIIYKMKEFDDEDILKQFWKDNVLQGKKDLGPRKKKTHKVNGQDFYGNTYKGIIKIMTKSEVLKRSFALTDKKYYRVFCCYRDKTNADTNFFLLVWRQKGKNPR